jgi:hypothetical protein
MSTMGALRPLAVLCYRHTCFVTLVTRARHLRRRVSYRPYREASGALMRLLRRFVNAGALAGWLNAGHPFICPP